MSDVPSDMDRRFAENDPGGAEPESPSGVWVEYFDGVRFDDLPLLYLGIDEDGLATFQVLTPRDEPVRKAGMKTFPARTALIVPRLAR